MALNSNLLAELKNRQEIHERGFVSGVPIIGPLIVWIRTQWNNIATRWYVLPLVQQQNEFNRQLVATLEDIREHLAALEENLADLDNDQMGLVRDVAETRYQLIRLRKKIQTVEVTQANTDTDFDKA